MTQQAAMNWGETKGEAQSNRVTYMKFNKGVNRIRIVGNILRRYIYWVTNSEGSKLPFENLDFSREEEKFENHGLNPVKELGLQSTSYAGNLEFDKDGKPKPLGSKKAYLVPVINRATNAVEYMELKKGIFDGINEVMGKLNDPKFRKRFVDTDYVASNPSTFDVIFSKTGEGIDTEYKVDILETMDGLTDEDVFKEMLAQHEKDKALLADLKPIEEVFPRPTYAEQKENLTKFMKGKAGQKEPDAPSGKTDFKSYDEEALDELED